MSKPIVTPLGEVTFENPCYQTIRFEDVYGRVCILQQSEASNEVLLGLEACDMRLSATTVKQLVLVLEQWADLGTGSFFDV